MNASLEEMDQARDAQNAGLAASSRSHRTRWIAVASVVATLAAVLTLRDVASATTKRTYVCMHSTGSALAIWAFNRSTDGPAHIEVFDGKSTTPKATLTVPPREDYQVVSWFASDYSATWTVLRSDRRLQLWGIYTVSYQNGTQYVYDEESIGC